MPTYSVYLRPKTSFASSIGSDTLFGALCWAMRALRGVEELEGMLKQFTTESQADTLSLFAVSSAFPFLYYGRVKVRLYPKPLIPELTSEQITPLAECEKQRHSALYPFQRATVTVVEKAKRVKSAAYVSEDLFTQIVRGETNTRRLCERLVQRGSADDDIVSWGRALITHGEVPCF